MITPVRARVATREYHSARIIRITNNIKHLNQLLSKITDFALLQGKLRESGNDTFFDQMVTSFWILNLIGPAGLFEHRPGDFEYNCRVSLFKKINWIEDDCALSEPQCKSFCISLCSGPLCNGNGWTLKVC